MKEYKASIMDSLHNTFLSSNFFW